MKKRIFKLLSLLFILCFPLFIKAESINITCNKTTLSIGEDTSCIIKGESTSITKLEMSLSTSDGLSIENVTKNSIWTGNDSTSSISYTSTNKSGNFEVLTLNIKANKVGNYNLSIGNVLFYDKDNVPTNVSAQKVSFRVKNNDANLKSLSVNGYELNPVFDTNTLNYKVQAQDDETVVIKAEANDSYSKVTGSGTKKLKYGDNTIKIVVTSEEGNSKTYKIVINRLDLRDKTNTLNNLVVSGYDLDKTFNKDKTTYSTTVESNVSSVKIKAELTPSDDGKVKSSFVKKYGPRTVNLKYGKNSIKVKVKAENEVVKEYTLNITRIDDRDPNNYLSSLEISSGRYTFNKDTTNYIINVENNVQVISVNAIAESEKATINDSKTSTYTKKVDLKVGSNKVYIEVKAENETTKKYTITINRLKEGTTIEEVENITYLKSLKVSNKNLSFSQKTLSYDIDITKDSNLIFVINPNDGVNGTISLKDSEENTFELKNGENEYTINNIIDGSIIVLELTSPEGYSREYTFKVKLADYYIGDIDIVDPNQKIEIDWTWQLIVALISIVILIAEIVLSIIFSIKNGGVENKNNEVKASIKKGLFKLKSKKEKEDKNN